MIEIREKPLRQTVMVRNLYPLELVKYIDVQDAFSRSKEKRDLYEYHDGGGIPCHHANHNGCLVRA